MERDLWPLIALALSPGNRLSPVQMQKLLFLVGRNLPKARDDAYYSFEPHFYGPYDSQINADLRVHRKNGLVERVESEAHRSGDFALTIGGKHAISKSLERLTAPEKQYLMDLAEWSTSLSFRALVSTIYERYPEFRVNSVFKE